jgi:hypothetical protein
MTHTPLGNGKKDSAGWSMRTGTITEEHAGRPRSFFEKVFTVPALRQETPAGRKAINDLLNALPHAIADELRGPKQQHAQRQYGALIVLAHTTIRKLGVNLQKTDDVFRKVTRSVLRLPRFARLSATQHGR